MRLAAFLRGRSRSAPVPTGPATPPAITAATPYLPAPVRVDGPVTVNKGTWSGTRPIHYDFVWKLDGDPIVGAPNSATYTIPRDASLIGKQLSVDITATNSAGSSTASALAVFLQGRGPVFTFGPAAPVGTIQEGYNISSSYATQATPSASIAIQWRRNGVDILPGGTSSTYTLVADDVGQSIDYVVTATNAWGVATAISPAVVPTAAPGVPPENQSYPVVSGSPYPGQTLTGTDGDWTGTAPIVFTYQWLRDGVTIPDATSNSYVVPNDPGEIGRVYQLEVTGTNDFGTASAQSTGTEIVEAPVTGHDYATWNPSDAASSVELSNGNLTWTASDYTTSNVRATFGKQAGKWYWEITVDALNDSTVGDSINFGVWPMDRPIGTYIYPPDGVYRAYQACAAGDVFGFAFDADAGTCEVFRNGVSVGPVSGEPLDMGGPWAPVVGNDNGGTATVTANFGQSAFAYTVPSGYNEGYYDGPAPGATWVVDIDATRDDLITYDEDGFVQTVTDATTSVVWTAAAGSKITRQTDFLGQPSFRFGPGDYMTPDATVTIPATATMFLCAASDHGAAAYSYPFQSSTPLTVGGPRVSIYHSTIEYRGAGWQYSGNYSERHEPSTMVLGFSEDGAYNVARRNGVDVSSAGTSAQTAWDAAYMGNGQALSAVGFNLHKLQVHSGTMTPEEIVAAETVVWPQGSLQAQLNMPMTADLTDHSENSLAMVPGSGVSISGGAAVFDGTADAFIEGPLGDALALPGDFDVRWESKLPADNTDYAGIVVTTDNGSYTNGWGIEQSAARGTLFLHPPFSMGIPDNPDDDQWHQYRFSRYNGVMNLYVDEQLKASVDSFDAFASMKANVSDNFMAAGAVKGSLKNLVLGAPRVIDLPLSTDAVDYGYAQAQFSVIASANFSGGALNLDGDGMLKASISGAITGFEAGQPFRIRWEEKTAGNGPNGYDIVMGSDDGGAATGWFIENSSTRGLLFTGKEFPGFQYFPGGYDPNDDTWHSYELRRLDGSTIELLIDGSVVHTHSHGGDIPSGGIFAIGADIGGFYRNLTTLRNISITKW